MRKKTIFFTSLVLGATLFGFVSFYLGIWGGKDIISSSAPKQVVVSEGGQTAVAPLPSSPSKNQPANLPGGGTKVPDLTGAITIVPSETDQLGYARLSPQGLSVMEAGAKVLQLPDSGSFAVYWLPKEKKVDRLLVLLHGSGGTAYDEIGDELAAAKENGYGLLALQWHVKSGDTYESGAEIYRNLSSLLDWLDRKESVQPKTRVLMGFSRGSAISFEVLSLDRSGRRFFTAAANLSGGIPSDAVANAQTSTRPDPFFVSLIVGQVAPDLYSGLRFYMYCGRMDEEWGPKMCDQMNYAQSLVVKYGAKVDTFVASETLGHRGLRADPVLHRAFVEWLLSL
ncbi:MAG: alpha/beta hydrolase [Undibacterium sp.]